MGVIAARLGGRPHELSGTIAYEIGSPTDGVPVIVWSWPRKCVGSHPPSTGLKTVWHTTQSPWRFRGLQL